MKKLFISTLLMFAIFVSTAVATYAADINANCSSTTCTPGSAPAFYSNSDVWFPEKSVTKTIQFSNNSGESIIITNYAQNTSSSGTANIANVIDFSIRRVNTNTIVWAGTLQAFYSAGSIPLGTISSGTTEVFEYTGTMNASAGNEYQETLTRFDLVWGVVTSGTPTPTPCSAQKPATPGGLSLNQLDSNRVRVTWNSVSDPKTGYNLMWGTISNAEGMGSRFTASTDTIVDGLNLNTTRYYFKVQAVNNCATGDTSGVSSIGTGSDLNSGGGGGGTSGTTTTTTTTTTGGTGTGLVAGAATFIGDVLGLTTDEEEATDEAETATPSATPTALGQALGANAMQCVDKPWWWLIVIGYLVFQTVLIILRKRIVPKTRLFLNIIGTIVTGILFIIALCWPWPWVLGAILLSILAQVFFKSSQIYRTVRTPDETSEPEKSEEDKEIKPVTSRRRTSLK